MAKAKAPMFGKKPPVVTGPSPHPSAPGAMKGKRKKSKPTGGQAAMTSQQYGPPTGGK